MKALHIFAAAAVALAVASCSSKPEISYMPAKADSGDNWGLVDANGEFLFEDEFSNRPSPAVNGIFYVKEGEGYTVYKAEKSPKQIGDLCDLKGAGYYTEGLIPVVHKGEHITFVDDEGKEKFTLDKVDGVNVKAVQCMFINGRCSFMTDDGKWGAIDTKGNVVVSPKYESQLFFVEDRALAQSDDKDKVVIIDKDGKEITTVSGISGKPSYLDPFIDGYTVLETYGEYDGNYETYASSRKFYTVTKDGEVNKLPSSVKSVRGWNDKYIVFEGEDDKWGIITRDGEVTVRAKYDGIVLLANGKFLGGRNDKTVYVDPKSGDTESLGKNVYPVFAKSAYILSKIFDFDFELIKEDDDEYELLSYNGKEKGEEMAEFSDWFDMYKVYSDYYDYEAVANSVVEMFDANGLKGFPFGSQMSNYVNSSRSASYYSYDKSLSVTDEYTSPYFEVSTATLRSDEYIVHNVSNEYYYSNWQFNPSSRVDYFSVTLSFGYNDFRDDLPKYIAKALKAKFGINADVDEAAEVAGLEYGYKPCRIDSGYCSVTISCGRYTWKHEEAYPVADAAEDAPADSVCVVEGAAEIPVTDAA